MSIRLQALIALVFNCSFAIGLNAQSLPSPPIQLRTMIEALDNLYANNGFPTRALTPDSYISPSSFLKLNRCQARAFGDTNSFSIVFKEGSSEVLRFYNWPAIHLLERSEDQNHAPSWSELRASKLAQQCALIFFPEMAKMCKPDFVNFSTDSPSSTSDRGAQWAVILRRFSKEGYPFRSDFINVQIGEQVGPLSAVMRIPSNFVERQYHPINKAQAKLDADKALELLRKANFSSWIQGPSSTIKVVHQPKLEVVNPYNTNAETLEDYAHSQGVEATLAWVTEYSIETVQPPGVSPKSTTQKYEVFIFVDAEDGHFLGADF